MKISIITASLNNTATIEDTIRSVISQNHQDIEHIIVDGCSTDGTLDVVGKYRAHIATFISEPDRGIYDAMNKGIALARGEVIGILNADDFYADADVISRVAELFGDPSVDACYGDLVYVDAADTSRVVRSWRSSPCTERSFYHGWMPPHPTFFVRHTVYEKFGTFNTGLGSAADYELMLRFLLKNRVRARYLPGVMVKMRTGGVSNASLQNRIRANRMDRLAWEVNGLRPLPWTLLMKPLSKIRQFFVKSWG